MGKSLSYFCDLQKNNIIRVDFFLKIVIFYTCHVVTEHFDSLWQIMLMQK